MENKTETIDNGCESCNKIKGIPDLPHIISKCNKCGREIHFLRYEKDGRSIKLNDGESLSIPSKFLSFSFNPLKSNAQLTRYGLEYFAKSVFLHNQKEDRSKGLINILREYQIEAEKILNESPLLNGLDMNNEDDEDSILSIMQENQNTPEFWALSAATLANIGLKSIEENDTNTAAWAIKSCEQCRVMYIFKTELEEVVWMGHGAKSLITLLNYWENNKTNSNELFWQKLLEDYQFAFSQIFSVPIVFIKGNAYVGGQKVDGKDANFVDYL